MKRFAAFALILCIGLFTIGCEKPKKDTTKDDKTTVEADADTKTDADAKTDDKTDEKAPE